MVPPTNAAVSPDEPETSNPMSGKDHARTTRWSPLLMLREGRRGAGAFGGNFLPVVAYLPQTFTHSVYTLPSVVIVV
jgi:hypothetical protein